MRYQDFLQADALAAYAAAINRRAALAGITGTVTAADLQDVILASGGRCDWCSARLIDADFEIDHVQPLVRGGINHRANLACACPACNRRKGDKPPVRFALELVAAGSPRTALITELLHAHDATPTIQRALFDDDSPPDSSADDASGDTVPPYRW